MSWRVILARGGFFANNFPTDANSTAFIDLPVSPT
jgi:hypothetical protein